MNDLRTITFDEQDVSAGVPARRDYSRLERRSGPGSGAYQCRSHLLGPQCSLRRCPGEWLNAIAQIAPQLMVLVHKQDICTRPAGSFRRRQSGWTAPNNQNLRFQGHRSSPATSQSSLPRPCWVRTFMPSRISVKQARTPGIPSTITWQSAQRPTRQ